MVSNPVVIAPLAAGGGGNTGSSSWWIIAPLLALLAAMALGTLAYIVKRKLDERKQDKDSTSTEKSSHALEKFDDPEKEHMDNLSAQARQPSADNGRLRNMKEETKLNEDGNPVPMSNMGKGKFIVHLMFEAPLDSMERRLYRLSQLQSSFFSPKEFEEMSRVTLQVERARQTLLFALLQLMPC